LSQLVSGASGCVETTGQPTGGPGYRFPVVVVLVSTRSARWRSRIGSTSFERDGFDSGCSYVAARLNQLWEGWSRLDLLAGARGSAQPAL